jgi:hypothetical protein
MSIDSNLDVQFNRPLSTGGKAIAYYRVQLDSSPTFNSALFRKPLEEVIVYSNMTSRRPDVQLVSVISNQGYTPSGTFVLQFLGQWTSELDYNISASGMTTALESLSTVNTVSVTRELFCSDEAGINNCGDNRGYVWAISFIDVIDNGVQVEEYVNAFETNLGSRLMVTGTYLQGCEKSRPTVCYSNSSAVAFVDSNPEVQEICVCNDNTVSFGATTGTVFGTYGVTFNTSMSVSALETIIEQAQGVGHVTVLGPMARPTGSCGCPGKASVYTVTFDSFLGDVPLMILSSGTAREVVKGMSQFVEGVADYSVSLPFDMSRFKSMNQTYLRVAAVNSVGTSEFVSPAENPIIKYKGSPDAPNSVAAVSSSKNSLKVHWRQTFNSSSSYLYDIEYDTSPVFMSYCTEPVCSSASAKPLGMVRISIATNITTVKIANETFYEYEVTNLIAGQAYFVRVRACYNATMTDRLCSPYSYEGYPSVPVSAVSIATPPPVGSAIVTLLNRTAVGVDWYNPQVLSEGTNGAPISAYTVTAATPVQELQQIRFSDMTSLFSSRVMLRYGSAVTRCIALSTSALDLEIKLEELMGLSALSVVYDTTTSSVIERVFSVAFDASMGNVPAISYGGPCDGASFSVSPVAVNTLTEGQVAFVPEIFQIVTQNSTSAPLSDGFFEIRYGFKGNFQKMAATADSSVSVSAVISAGSRTLVLSSSLNHLIAPGAVIRMGDQEVTVQDISTSGLAVTFTPYHVKGSNGAPLNVFVSETLLASATITSTKTFTMTTDISSEVSKGDHILITRGNQGTDEVSSSVTAVVSLIRPTLLTIVDSVNFVGTASKVLVYRQKNRIVPYDSAADEMKNAVQSLSAVGTVDVTRFGPTQANGFSWSISFTSVFGTTQGCSGSCMKVFQTSSAAITLTTGADYGGDYVSDSFSAGRRVYSKLNSPYFIIYSDVAGSWELRARGVSSTVSTCQTMSTSLRPILSCGSISSTSPDLMYGSLTGTVVQSGIAPSVLNTAAASVVDQSISEVQAISVTSSDGIITGGFNLDFNSSSISVYFRADESAKDMETKLESLPTVGNVFVSRTELAGMTGAFIGYQWLVTFISNGGDVPLLTYSAAPLSSLPLGGNNVKITVEEVKKGSILSSVTYLSGLIMGDQYTVQVFAANSDGLGESTLTAQNDGRGVMPLSFNLIGESSPPILSSVVAKSSSQLDLMISPPVLSGGEDASSYLLEYTTNTSFGLTEQLTFRMFNKGSNASDGFFRLNFLSSVTGNIKMLS